MVDLSEDITGPWAFSLMYMTKPAWLCGSCWAQGDCLGVCMCWSCNGIGTIVCEFVTLVGACVTLINIWPV